MLYDVVIVGGGPAGLSAALILGRCRRKVLVCDAGKPRNAASRHLHGYLTRENISPQEFLQIARQELSSFPSVEVRPCEVTDVRKKDYGFAVALHQGSSVYCKKLLIATGVIDELPKIEGIEKFFGKSVFQCPYCDGWEVRDKRVGVYGKEQRGLKLVISLTAWTRNLILFSDGPCGLKAEEREFLRQNEIRLEETPVARLDGDDAMLNSVVMADGRSIRRDALFFNTPSFIRSTLIDQLGCEFSHDEGVYTGKYAGTEIPGMYAAGNILRDVQLAIVAAAEGARAAFGINSELTNESLRWPERLAGSG